MKFRTLGKKMSNMVAEGPSKDRIHFPRIHFDENQLPEILDWKIGGEYEVLIKIRQTSIRKEKDRPATADFDVLAVSNYHEDEASKKAGKKVSDMLVDRRKG